MATSNNPQDGTIPSPAKAPALGVNPPFLANSPETAAVADLDRCVADAEVAHMNAVDAFELQQRWLCKRAFEFTSDQFELGLLLMALASATESYFRAVLAASLVTCPICNDHNIDKGKLSLRAISYYPESLVPLALLEHVSFSDAEAVRKQTQELLQIEVPKSDKGASSLASALQEFDKICALRHSLIHSLGFLNSQNCAEAGIGHRGLKVVAVTIDGFQVAADVCLSVVHAFNQFLFSRLMARLYQRGVLTGAREADGPLVQKVATVFLSRTSPAYTHDTEAIVRSIQNSFAQQ